MAGSYRQIIHSAGIAHHGGIIAPGALLFEDGELIASGSPESIGMVDAAEYADRRGHLLMPALVNAHCHLDLTAAGPQPYRGDFVDWIETVRTARSDQSASIDESIRQGIALSKRGGTGMVGDIAAGGGTRGFELLRESGLFGISYLEFFGIGESEQAGLQAMKRAIEASATSDDRIRLGLQPHAPYSCAPSLYKCAAESNLPLATHLAETREELRFVERGDGPLADMLRSFGLWRESIKKPTHRLTGQHPIEAMADLLATRPCLVAHLNYVAPRHLAQLATWPISVVYCPRASHYFGHPPHRYQSMLELGIDVALGTDSIICLDTSDRISVLDEMRLLYRRDGCDGQALLSMATVHGAVALGFDPKLVSFDPGPTLGVVGVSVDTTALSANLSESERGRQLFEQVMSSEVCPEWIYEALPVGTRTHEDSGSNSIQQSGDA